MAILTDRKLQHDMELDSAHSYHEDGANIHHRNLGNTAYIHTVQIFNCRIKNEGERYDLVPKSSALSANRRYRIECCTVIDLLPPCRDKDTRFHGSKSNCSVLTHITKFDVLHPVVLLLWG